MKSRLFISPLVVALLCSAVSGQETPSAVTLTQDGAAFTLSNGIVTARILKRNGDIASLIYKGADMFTSQSGHAGGYWSHDPTGGKELIARVTIDPASNNGERAEVSVKGISGGIKMGHGPGAAADGDFPADIEIRYALGKGESGVYTYCTFEHKPEYPAATITEARYCAKLADYFDWMSVADDKFHHKAYPSTLREGDKYVYTTNQYKNPAFGWSSTTKNVGLFIINPSNEYMSGGPTKVEFLGHRDTTAVAAPCVLNYWRSSHYGGAEVTVAAGEHWVKVIGPFMIYANSGADPQAIYNDARAQAAKEQAKWPYDWVAGVDYPISSKRATVKGRLALTDPLMPAAKMSNVMVGLTAPVIVAAGRGGPPPAAPGAATPGATAPGAASAPGPARGPVAGGGGRGGLGGPIPPRMVDWQQNAKNYQFWVKASDDGTFEIPDVRPGTYTMHAFADGILGEYVKTDVVIEEGKPLNMGNIAWTPVRRGKQLWDIGIPNRSSIEFFKGDIYYTINVGAMYATLFPEDKAFVIGKSDHAADWFFQHVPRANPVAPAPVVAPASAPATPGAPGIARGRGTPVTGRATPRAIQFNLASAPKGGKATLRAAFNGTGTANVTVAVNDQPIGPIPRLVNDGVLSNHGSHGIWYERELTFDASLLKQGDNTLTLTVPAGGMAAGVMYDYLRLELDENAQ